MSISANPKQMLCPAGLEAIFGKWWRECMAIFSLPFAFVVCYLPKATMEWIFGISTADEKTEKQKKK